MYYTEPSMVAKMYYTAGGAVDHTFVLMYKGNNHETDLVDIFKCFGGATENPTPVAISGIIQGEVSAEVIQKIFNEKITSGAPVRGRNDSTRMHYGINGVCQQATNRFLLPVHKSMAQNKDGRPKGYNNSCWMYGTYGNNYNSWRKNQFNKSWEIYTTSPLPANAYPGEYFKQELRIEFENVYNKLVAGDISPIESIIAETSIRLKNSVEGFDEYPIYATHREILLEKDHYFEALGIDVQDEAEIRPSFSAKDIKQAAKKVNELSKNLHAALKDAVGEEAFIAFNGSEEFYDIIQEDLALELLCGDEV